VEASALPAPQAHRLRISLSAPLLRLRSDEQLVALFRAGNEEAFRTIHDRYRSRLSAYVRQMLGGSQSDAEDTLQDVFLRAYGSLRTDQREIALRAWLYRVAHNRCIDQLRRPVPRAADVFDVSRTPSVEPATATERREDLRRLIEDVQRLPEQQRSVLLMREMDGLSYADLAAALDVSIPAVKSLLVRARMSLVQAAEARDTACVDVRHDLAAAHGRGVRANGRARRHLRDCAGCRAYRTELRGRQKALAGLSPVAGVGPLSVLAQLLGGSGAAGGGAVAGSGGAMVGGSAAAVSATKVALVVGAAVVTAGGAVEVRSQMDKPVRAHSSHVAAAAPRKASLPPRLTRITAPARPTSAMRAAPAAGTSPGAASPSPPPADPAGAPGVAAPAPVDAVPAVGGALPASPATAPAASVPNPTAANNLPKVLPVAPPPPAETQPVPSSAATTAAPASTAAASGGSAGSGSTTAEGSGASSTAGGGATSSSGGDEGAGGASGTEQPAG
jgi:RNA polymerase sigma factor (sigma-70 family)